MFRYTKKNKRTILSTILLIVLVIFVLYLYKSKNDSAKVKHNLIVNEFDITYGVQTAPLKVYMFSNYNCIHCKNFLSNVFPEIEKEYINSEQVQFVIKPLSLSSSQEWIDAYKTAVCLNKFGDFTELNELLLHESNAIFSEQFKNLIDYYIGKNTSFAECMLSGDAETYLKQNMVLFLMNELKSTPTFIINGNIYTGYKDIDKFSEIINKELRQL